MAFLFDDKFTSGLPGDDIRNLQVKALIEMQLQTNIAIASLAAESKIVNARLESGDLEIKAIKTLLVENTKITRHVQDAVTAGHVATKVIKWLGIVAVACTAIYTAVYMATHEGKPP